MLDEHRNVACVISGWLISGSFPAATCHPLHVSMCIDQERLCMQCRGDSVPQTPSHIRKITLAAVLQCEVVYSHKRAIQGFLYPRVQVSSVFRDVLVCALRVAFYRGTSRTITQRNPLTRNPRTLGDHIITPRSTSLRHAKY